MANGNGRILSPLGTLISIITTVVIGVTFITAQIYRLDKRMLRIELATGDRWRSTDMQNWAHRLERENEGLNVPNPSDVLRDRAEQYGHGGLSQ
jgi:hypothetical protein